MYMSMENVLVWRDNYFRSTEKLYFLCKTYRLQAPREERTEGVGSSQAQFVGRARTVDTGVENEAEEDANFIRLENIFSPSSPQLAFIFLSQGSDILPTTLTDCNYLEMWQKQLKVLGEYDQLDHIDLSVCPLKSPSSLNTRKRRFSYSTEYRRPRFYGSAVQLK